MKKFFSKLDDALLTGSVKVQGAVTDFVQRNYNDCRVASQVLAVTGLFIYADAAMAASLGQWAQSFKNETMKPLIEFGMYGAYAFGLGCVGNGANKYVKVSRGDQQTSFGEATGWTFGGGALMGLGAIANHVGDSMSLGENAFRARD